MAQHLTKELFDLLAAPEASAAIATIDEQGFPHVVSGLPLQGDADGNLLYLEYFESSPVSRNLLRSLWFDRPVSVAVSAPDGRSYQVKGRPAKVHITGSLFLEQYERIRAELGDINLAAVWVIEPQQIIDENIARSRTAEETERPFFTHLDRLVR